MEFSGIVHLMSSIKLTPLLCLTFSLVWRADSVNAQQGVQSDQRDLPSTSAPCELIIQKAILLNERFKTPSSANFLEYQTLRLESETYYDDVLLKNISVCVDYSASKSDLALSKLLFELAYSYSNSADEIIPLELARFYSKKQKMAKAILLDFDKTKRHELIKTLKLGLDNFYYKKPEASSRLRILKTSLDQIESK
jgi:hypothetical protein